MGIKKYFTDNHYLMYYYACKAYVTIRFKMPYAILGERRCAEKAIKEKYRRVFNNELDFNNPRTLNEKIQWMKLYDHDALHTIVADKYRSREYWEKYGKDGLIPLLFCTYDIRKFTEKDIPDVPCVVKWNSGSGDYVIIRDKSKTDFKDIRAKCAKWMASNYYYASQERQYKDMKSCIIIEKLLMDSQGRIPNDYKLHYINGELQFIYCSIDREGLNYRAIYSPKWERIDMEWVEENKQRGCLYGPSINPPKTLGRMIEIGNDIATSFKYVRVDFYDVEGKMYYGEITLHHGSGLDKFRPEEMDLYYGEKLKLK